jgi:hypothetical protein
MKKRAAKAAPAPVVAVEPVPAPPAPPAVLLAPEPPAHVRRDLTGRIVEYERRPVALASRMDAAPVAAPTPRTMTELNELRRVRLAEIAAAAETKRQQARIEASRIVGPVIVERDKKVQEARRVLDDHRSRLRKQEEETIARITREARAKFKQLGDDMQNEYNAIKLLAHNDARAALVAGAEEPLQARLATIEAETEAARVDIIAWCTEQEGAIREAEKAAAAAAGATLGALAPAAASASSPA